MSEPTFWLLGAMTATERMAELARFISYWFGPRRKYYRVSPATLDRLPLPT